MRSLKTITLTIKSLKEERPQDWEGEEEKETVGLQTSSKWSKKNKK